MNCSPTRAINNSVTDNNFTYQLANGTPVDLGIVSTGGHLALRDADHECDHASDGQLQLQRILVLQPGAESAIVVSRPSASAFESSYLKNLVQAARRATASGNNTVTDFDESIDGWASRTLTRGSTTGGPA